MPEEAGMHAGCSPGALLVAAESGLMIILPLNCRVCGATQTKVAPPPEQSPIQRAQVLPVATVAVRSRYGRSGGLMLGRKSCPLMP